jgi:hypothetical protein
MAFTARSLGGRQIWFVCPFVPARCGTYTAAVPIQPNATGSPVLIVSALCASVIALGQLGAYGGKLRRLRRGWAEIPASSYHPKAMHGMFDRLAQRHAHYMAKKGNCVGS